MAKITTNSTNKEICDIAMPHYDSLKIKLRRWGERNKRFLKDLAKRQKRFEVGWCPDEEDENGKWFLVPHILSWSDGHISTPDGTMLYCWFHDIVTQRDYALSVNGNKSIMYSPHCLKRVRERAKIPVDNNFDTLSNMVVGMRNGIIVKGMKKYGTTNKYVAAHVCPIGVFFGWADVDRDVYMFETFVTMEMLHSGQKIFNVGSFTWNYMAVREYVRQGKAPRSILEKYHYDAISHNDCMFFKMNEDNSDIDFLSYEEIMNTMDNLEDHSEEVVAESQANRIRWKRKMMRKGYK